MQAQHIRGASNSLCPAHKRVHDEVGETFGISGWRADLDEHEGAVKLG
jgi:hypothetical protein